MACAFILFLLYYSGLQDLQEVQCPMPVSGLVVFVNLIGRMFAASTSVGYSSGQSRIRDVIFSIMFEIASQIIIHKCLP